MSPARRMRAASSWRTITRRWIARVCHTSWATSCFGCHMPMKANERVITNKFEGTVSRNFTTYNPQVVRDDVFMLGLDGTVKGHRLAVIRSSSAVVVGSQNANREWVYSQEQTVLVRGLQRPGLQPAFCAHHQRRGHDEELHGLPSFPRSRITTRSWRSCSALGLGNVNFFGRYAYVGGGHGRLLRRRLDQSRMTAGGHRAAIAKDRLSARFCRARRRRAHSPRGLSPQQP